MYTQHRSAVALRIDAKWVGRAGLGWAALRGLATLDQGCNCRTRARAYTHIHGERVGRTTNKQKNPDRIGSIVGVYMISTCCGSARVGRSSKPVRSSAWPCQVAVDAYTTGAQLTELVGGASRGPAGARTDTASVWREGVCTLAGGSAEQTWMRRRWGVRMGGADGVHSCRACARAFD